jgi:hypothetical protein
MISTRKPVLTSTRFWEFIRTDNLDAADKMIAEILSAIRALVSLRRRKTALDCRSHALWPRF